MRKLRKLLTLKFLEDQQSIENESNISKKRTKMIFTTLFVFFFVWILIYNIGQMSVLGTIRGKNLSEIADKKYKIDSVLEPNRGKIYDRNGNVLADNIESYKLIAVVSDKASEGLEDDAPRKHVVDVSKTAEELSKLINLSKEAIEKILKNDKAYQVEFGSYGKDINVETKRKIEDLKLPGIKFETTTKRYYPNGSLLGNFLGFAQTSSDDSDLIVGKLGIERVFDYYLRGKSGRIVYARDAWGKVVSNIPATEVKPVNGADLYLTIDKNIQGFVDNTLKDIHDKYEPESAFAVVMSAKTGEILGIGQTPAFNPNTKENLDKAWTNAVFNSAVEPGSTMKTFSLAIMMENNIFDPNKYYKSGSYKVYDTTIYDHNKNGWGTISYRHGFQESSNTLMLTMLEQLGRDKFKLGLEKFGFGKKTGSLYENEASGQLAFNNVVSASTSVFGQGSTVTPIQMLQAETAILNEGNMLKPYFVKRIHDNYQNIDVNVGRKEIVGNPISKNTAERVKEELYGVVNGEWSAGGKKYRLDDYVVAGKTGTAEVVNPETGVYYKSTYKVMHSFLGYAPSDNPEIVVYAVIKLPSKKENESYSNSVKELFNPVMQSSLDYLNIKKVNENISKDTYSINNYIGNNINNSINDLSTNTKNIVVLGSGNSVTNQFPSADNIVNKNDKVFLLTEDTQYILPNFKGWSKADVLRYAELANIKISIEGNGYVKEQSILPGKYIKPDEELKLKLS
ncbi:PASTA domain-containing protein [Gemella sp. zg-570]|uniref:penicillin-binding transpeptidase domain-containing protein n=1 Tax=Gemella sp. zg-570 TaxID=2840371 RepID=UPI001C0BF07B|nr:penicillin-binding transpeptidase domain-containing protein [Gemella sp. zg-570]QWQ39361.1 PASTA domain-containing protein [Gemella sp. zg-570]